LSCNKRTHSSIREHIPVNLESPKGKWVEFVMLPHQQLSPLKSLVREHILVPVREHILVPVREHILVSVREHILVPVREHILVPVREHILIPVREHILVPVKEHILSRHGCENVMLYATRHAQQVT
jgi:hypothetical protein